MAAPTGTKPAIRDTSAMSATVFVLPSVVRRLPSSETPEETGGSIGVGARNYDNPLQSIYETNGRTSPSCNSGKPSLIA
jgi:hypothetical protein